MKSSEQRCVKQSAKDSLHLRPVLSVAQAILIYITLRDNQDFKHLVSRHSHLSEVGSHSERVKVVLFKTLNCYHMKAHILRL